MTSALPNRPSTLPLDNPLPLAEPSLTTPRQFLDHLLASRNIVLPKIPNTCVILYSDRLMSHSQALQPFASIDLGCVVPANLHFFSPPEGEPFAVVGGLAGAPMAAALLEELVALGFQRFLTVGCAGHPCAHRRPRIPIGSIVVADSAIVCEGTTPHYDPQALESFPGRTASAELRGLLGGSGLEYSVGPVATTDALYRETSSLLSRLIARGALAIDMELSALSTVASHRRVEVVGLLYISDIIDKDHGWQLGLADGQVTEVEDRLWPIILKFAGAP
jgi:uridine phosphorylase